MSSKIQSVHARQIIDCKCRPMVEVDVITEDGSIGTGCAPTGSSVGMYESYVLRDNDPKEYHGLSVHKAVDNVNRKIAPTLVGMDVHDLAAIDHKMIDLDGTNTIWVVTQSTQYLLQPSAQQPRIAVCLFTDIWLKKTLRPYLFPASTL